MTADLLYAELTEPVIGAAYQVFNTLGSGFLEKVYENALRVELELRGLAVRQQAPIKVLYLGQEVGEFFADLLVDGRLLVELKACERLAKIHESQLVNYLKATDLPVGLLINFGPRIEIRRRVSTRPYPRKSQTIRENPR